MAEHGIGLRPNGQAGAPVVGVERTQIGSAADVRQRGVRETDTKAAGKSESNIPQFKDNPIGAIGIILQEVAAGMKGTSGPVAAAHKQAIEEQSFQLRKDAQTLQAIKFGMEQLEAFPGGDRGALVATITKISPEAGAVLSEMSKAAVEKSRALLDLFDENPEMFPGAAKLARLVGVEKAVEIYGGIAGEVAKRKVLGGEFTEPVENDRGQLIQVNKGTNEVKVLDQEQNEFSEPFRNADGDLVQQNLRSNEIKVLSKTGKTAEDIKARTGAKSAAEAADAAKKSATGIANISETMRELESAASAGGLSGLAIEKIGGFLGQFSKAAEEGFAKLLGDATPQEVQAIRTRSRAIVAQMLSEITGEESGRFTEQERAIAEQALKTLDPNASPTQIRSALAVGLELRLLSRDRQLTIAGVASKFDLDTKEGFNAKGADLQKLGLKNEEIVPILKRMRLQRRLMKDIQ